MSYKNSLASRLRSALKGEGYVVTSSSAIEAHNDNGELLVSLEKTVHGEYKCKKKQNGAKYSLVELLDKK